MTFNDRNDNRKRSAEFSQSHRDRDLKKRKTLDLVYSMKKNLVYGEHYQIDPKAVGFSGVHIEKEKIIVQK